MRAGTSAGASYMAVNGLDFPLSAQTFHVPEPNTDPTDGGLGRATTFSPTACVLGFLFQCCRSVQGGKYKVSAEGCKERKGRQRSTAGLYRTAHPVRCLQSPHVTDGKPMRLPNFPRSPVPESKCTSWELSPLLCLEAPVNLWTGRLLPP